MGGRISLKMQKFSPVGKGLIKPQKNIVDNVGVGVFVYCYSCRCMRAEDYDLPVLYTTFSDGFTNF